MAEYIDKDEAIDDLLEYKELPNLFGNQDKLVIRGCIDRIKNHISIADVVERESYEHEYFLRKELELENYKLHSKIDKAIEKIKEKTYASADGDIVVDFDDILKILKN